MKLFEISRNDKCLCGSNIKYKYCCMNKINDKNYLKKAIESINSEEYDEAYIFCNADLTKYLIGMKRHTEPLLKKNEKLGNELLEIDLKALEELFNRLLYIMYHGNIKINIYDKFSRLENIIDNKKYYELIRYYHILLIKIFDDNTDKIVNLLSNLDYKEIQRIELLEFFYHEIAINYVNIPEVNPSPVRSLEIKKLYLLICFG